VGETRRSRLERRQRARLVRTVQVSATVALFVLAGSLALLDWERVQALGEAAAFRVIGIQDPPTGSTSAPTTTLSPGGAEQPAPAAAPGAGGTTTTGAQGPTTTAPPTTQGPQPLLFDEFNGLDAGRWLAADYRADTNQELQYYSPDNVAVRDGVLVITTEERAVGGRQYASGLVSSAGRFSFTYGTVEWRAQLPAGRGMWPALWLLGADCAGTFENGSQLCPTWPVAGSSEVDVLEGRGSQPNVANFARHFNTAAEAPDDHFNCDWAGPDLSAGWHTYGLTRTPDALVWTVDGQERCRTTEDIPDEPMFLIMNVAVGGSFDGAPDGGTALPQEFLIDWVRVTEPE
jgi:beta-glucanase (GH16 family)